MKKFFYWLLSVFQKQHNTIYERAHLLFPIVHGKYKRKHCKTCNSYEACCIAAGHSLDPMRKACTAYQDK